MVWSPAPPATPPPSIDLLESYQLARQLGGALDFSAPMQGPFRIIASSSGRLTPHQMLALPATISATQPELAPEDERARQQTPVPTSRFQVSRQQERRCFNPNSSYPTSHDHRRVSDVERHHFQLQLRGPASRFPATSPPSRHKTRLCPSQNLGGHFLSCTRGAQERSISLQTKTPASRADSDV